MGFDSGLLPIIGARLAWTATVVSKTAEHKTYVIFDLFIFIPTKLIKKREIYTASRGY
jgi:hypothetical protein